MTETEIIIRDIVLVEEMRAVEEMQIEVWGISERDVASVFMMAATNAAGGVLVGAFDGARLVGFAYGFVGLEGGHAIMHSDMLAVKREYRGRDIGRRLKLAQRERALARGLRLMTWTFDPLQAANAHLNFGKLGVVSDRYVENFYGEQSSSFLHSTGTDRLWVTWPLDSARVRARAGGARFVEDASALEGLTALVRVGEDDAPSGESDDASARGGRALIEIPGHIGELEKRDAGLARAWRLATRRAFTAAIGAGRLVEEFYRVDRGARRVGVYLLTHGKRVEDFDA